MFLGFHFAAQTDNARGLVEPEQSFNKITLAGQYAEKLYGDSEARTTSKGDWYQTPEHWSYKTLFVVNFDENLSGGNITHSTESVKGIKIKRKLPQETNWKTIYYKQNISSSKDFDLVDEEGNQLVDFLEPNDTDIEYMYVPVFHSDEEGTEDIDINSRVVKVHSHFEADVVVGRNDYDLMVGYPARLNPTFNYQRQRNNNAITTLGSKYPFVINNGLTDYYSGEMQAIFMLLRDDCSLDIEGSDRYRDNLNTFLSNGKAKLIKTCEGQLFLVAINGAITNNSQGYYTGDNKLANIVNTKFNWTQIGDALDINDLYDNNFINSNIDEVV